MTQDEIRALIDSVPDWYHSYDLCGVLTPGRLKIDVSYLNAIGVPQSLEGLRVLEIGSWDGAYTWELERRNPASLDALDIQHPDHTGFNIAKKILDSKVRYHHRSVYRTGGELLLWCPGLCHTTSMGWDYPPGCQCGCRRLERTVHPVTIGCTSTKIYL